MLERIFRTFVKLFWDEYNNSSSRITLEILILLIASVVYCFNGVGFLTSIIIQVLTFMLLIFARKITVSEEETKEKGRNRTLLSDRTYPLLFCIFVFVFFCFVVPYIVLNIKFEPLTFVVFTIPQILIFIGFSVNLYKYIKQ